MDGENRGEHDRLVVRALRSLEQLTGPTAIERQRIQDRILLALDEEPGDPADAKASPWADAAHGSLPSATHRAPKVTSRPPGTTAQPYGTTADATGTNRQDGGGDPTGGTGGASARSRRLGRSTAVGGDGRNRPAARTAASLGSTGLRRPGRTTASPNDGEPPAAAEPPKGAAADRLDGPTAAPEDATETQQAAPTTPPVGTTETQQAAPTTPPVGTTDNRPAERTTATAGTRSVARTPAAGGDSGTRRTGRTTASGHDGPSRPAGRRGQVRPRGRNDDRTTGPHTGRKDEQEPGRRGVLAGARGRLAVAALALLTLVGSLTGMSVLLSRDALPGDALYGVKRTAEAAALGLTFGDEPKALKHLEFASSRVSEIETLARRYGNPGDAPVGDYLTALTDFDIDATAGSRQLIAVATSTGGRLLESLRDWSAQQASRLERVAGHLPEAARNRQTASRALLNRITTRALTLLTRMDCYQTTSGSFDDIGALPAAGQCETGPAPTGSTSPPSVAPPTDSSAPQPTAPETPSPSVPGAVPTPAPTAPPLPVPGATITVPIPTTEAPAPNTSTTTPPFIQLPPLLPGLPTVSIG